MHITKSDYITTSSGLVIVPNLVKKGEEARNSRVEQKEGNGAKQSDPQA